MSRAAQNLLLMLIGAGRRGQGPGSVLRATPA